MIGEENHLNVNARIGIAVLAAMLLSACASGFTRVAPEPPATYSRLGPASATACGTLGVGPTAYNFIPMALNSRVERAYNNALSSVPGATALVDVTVQESWFWWVIGTTRCVNLSGVAIR